MLKTLSTGSDPGVEPPPRFASDAEIALAEQLRRQLEARYFGPPATSQIRPGQNH